MTAQYELASEQQTTALAAALAPGLGVGDTLLLSGPVGAGKSLFARALIQTLQGAAGGPVEDVPSPSFTLVQTYDAGALQIWHADLYRLTDPDEVSELGLSDAFSEALVLVEWPALLGVMTPRRHLAIDLAPHATDPNARLVTLTPSGEAWDPLMQAAQSVLEHAA